MGAPPAPGGPQRGRMDYSTSRAPYHIKMETEDTATRELRRWISRLMDDEQRAVAVSIKWLLQHHRDRRDHTIGYVMFQHPEEPHRPLVMMTHPSLMEHLRVNTPSEANRLHWSWHKRAALRVRRVMVAFEPWEISTSGPQGSRSPNRHTRHKRQRYPTSRVSAPPRKMTRNSPPPRQMPVYSGSTYHPHGSLVRSFQQQRDSPRTPAGPRNRRGPTSTILARATSTHSGAIGEHAPTPSAPKSTAHHLPR